MADQHLGRGWRTHAIYLHSGLTQDRLVARTDREQKRLLRFSNREVVLALGLAGLVLMLNLLLVLQIAGVPLPGFPAT